MTQFINKQLPSTDPLESIIEGCRKNDLWCQEQLYRLCYAELIATCSRYAGDMDGVGIIFNNAMLRVFKSIQGYRHQGKLMAWIKTIVINCSIDFVNHKKIPAYEPINTDTNATISIEAKVLDNISVKEIQEIIHQLPRATAVVFNLFVYEGYTHKQISELLKISEGTSKWHVSEGRRMLKNKLEK